MKTFILFSRINFLMSNHPISICIIIVLTILIISIYIWKVQSLFLSFYIISIIFIGGIIILFIYISSIAPNIISSPFYFPLIPLIPIVLLFLEIKRTNETSSLNTSFAQTINQELIILILMILISIFILIIWITLNPLHSIKSRI